MVGIVSDTHGLLRPEVLEAFKDVSLILHAGDIGSSEVLEDLEKAAPVVAVRGNNDKGEWANCISESEVVRAGAVSIYVLHDLNQMIRNPKPEDVQVVVSGHSHRPSIERREGVLFVNPGSAGPRRFNLPVSIARLKVQGPAVHAEIITLSAGGSRRR